MLFEKMKSDFLAKLKNIVRIIAHFKWSFRTSTKIWILGIVLALVIIIINFNWVQRMFRGGQNTNQLIVPIPRKELVALKNEKENVERINLIENASFEQGLWQKEPKDCTDRMAGEPSLSIRLSEDASDGKYSLELGSKNHYACVSKKFPIKLSKDKVYKYSFDYKSIKGDKVESGCHLKGEEISYPFSVSIEAKNHNWNHHEIFIEPLEDTDGVTIYFYAPSDGTKEVINRFDNVRLEEWMPKDMFYYLYSKTEGKEETEKPKANLITAIFWIPFFGFLFFKRDVRILIVFALILLASYSVLLILKKETIGEQIVVYSYYFLLLAVVLQLVEYRMQYKKHFNIHKGKIFIPKRKLVIDIYPQKFNEKVG